MSTHTLPPEVKLAPCPFCGKTDRVVVSQYLADDDGGEPFSWGFIVQCSALGVEGPHSGCGASSGWGETEADAITAWNRRAEPSGARVATPEVKVLLDWLDKRGLPDSGIRYEAGSHANTRGIRHSLSHVQLHGADADFIAKHLLGEGARNLAVALRSALEPSGEGVGGMEGVTEDQAAYGLLWRMHTTDQTIHSARHTLLDKIGKDGQRAGLAWALKAFGPNPIPTTEEMP